jgi:hypothetical protein
MDELAAAAGADPIEFRLRYLDPSDRRGICSARPPFAVRGPIPREAVINDVVALDTKGLSNDLGGAVRVVAVDRFL